MQIAVWFWVLVGVCARWWPSPCGPSARAACTAGGCWPHLFATGLLPQVVQRADTAHLSWVSCVPFGLLPAFLAEAARLRGTRVALRRTAMLAPAGAAVPVPPLTYRWYDYVAQSVGYDRAVYSVDHRGRSFYYGRQDVLVAAEAMLDDVER